jgi:hypothetical protein
MRLIGVLGVGLLFCLDASGQSNSTVASEHVEVRSDEVYTCACLFFSKQVSAGKEAEK